MNFVQIEFLFLFATTFVVYWRLPSRKAQNLLLVATSMVFYGWIHPWFLILLYASATVDYFVGLGMRAQPGHRKKLLFLSVATNLSMLGFFKYFDFFVANVAQAIRSAGFITDLTTLGILLPVGISFYTFQTMSYTIDVYRGVLEPRRNYVDYVAFVSFFCQLVAGPIERAGRLLPQLETARTFSWSLVTSGLGLALWGGFKKIVIADTLAPHVDKVFMLKDPSGAVLWAGALAFGLQLYADFSAYTDIARGTARMLGFDLVRNFREPFLAVSTPDFWRRWHMSLSFWIRDYVLVPLLGRDTPSTLRVAGALIGTFLLIGLWHGAGWNYLAFGAWHAVWVLVYLWAAPRVPGVLKRMPGAVALAILLHTCVVQIPGSVIFREPRVSRTLTHFTRAPWEGDRFELHVAVTIVSYVVVLSLPLIGVWAWTRFVRPKTEAWGRWVWPITTTAWAVMILAMAIFYRETSRDFIYFQF